MPPTRGSLKEETGVRRRRTMSGTARQSNSGEIRFAGIALVYCFSVFSDAEAIPLRLEMR